MNPPKTFHSLQDLSNILPPSADRPPSEPPDKKEHDGKGKTVRVVLDTKGRKGKSVTLVEGLQHNPQTMEDIARILKNHCGAGGTVKEGRIEIQGDNRARVSNKLREMKYKVK